jgi:hypothetical protein
MPLDLADYETIASAAVKKFWTGRTSALLQDLERQQGGERAAVLSGKNMDGFLAMIQALVERNGLPHAAIHTSNRPLLTLPGYFRPTKMWDVLVMDVAAIELKSQVGPSFGNNYNNRTEEAIGTAKDLWTAVRENVLGDQPTPFVGWLILVEDCAKSRKPVRDRSPHFSVFEDFKSASYLDRYEILCRRLTQEQLYTQASVMVSPRTSGSDGVYLDMSGSTSLTSFVAAFAAHIAKWAAIKGA